MLILYRAQVHKLLILHKSKKYWIKLSNSIDHAVIDINNVLVKRDQLVAPIRQVISTQGEIPL